MPRIFLSNFHFEHELANSRFAPTRKLLEINARNALSWLKLARPGDIIALPDVAVADEISAQIKERSDGIETLINNKLPTSSEWIATPWGWTTPMLQLAEKNRWMIQAPSIESVKQINSRRFAFELEITTSLQPRPSLLATSLEDVNSFLLKHNATSGWLLKGEFGMSGRERIHLEKPDLNPSQLGWLKNEFSAGHAVVVEPLLQRLDEVSVHYDVDKDGTFQRRGIVALTSDARGQFADAVIGTDEDQKTRFAQWASILPHTDHAAQQASHSGYTGPLGIDAMRFVSREGETTFRPLQDINARWTMGRLALEASLR